jgi:signal peptidase II
MALDGKKGYLLVALAVLVLDQWSKWWIETELPFHATRPVIDGFFNLTHVRNTGVAFGFLAGSGQGVGPVLLSLLGFAALGFVGLYFWRATSRERSLLIGLGLILGGAVGNLLDRLASGAVTDFLDFYLGSYHWHTFNLADSAITVGIGCLLLDSVWRSREKSEEAPSRAA